MNKKSKILWRVLIAIALILISTVIVVFGTTMSDKASLIAVLATCIIILTALSSYAAIYSDKEEKHA